MALFRYILLFFLFYLIIRFLRSLLFPPSRPQQFYQRTRDQYQRSRDKEGDIHINKQREGKDKIIRKDDGEYINYEEIKED